MLLEHLAPDDDIGDTGFVFNGQEHHAFRSARHLPDQDEAGDGDALVLRQAFAAVVGGGDSADAAKPIAEKADRMRLQRKTRSDIILRHMFGELHQG